MAVSSNIYDIIIIGAGPAGCSAALYAQRHGLKTLLVEKSRFPRDKICGDALSGKSMQVLYDLDLAGKVQELPGAVIRSITFSNPRHDMVNISLLGDKRKGLPTGIVMPRKQFDSFLFNEVKKTDTEIREDFTVKEILHEDGQVTGIRGENEEFYGRIILGADGFNSIIARKMDFYEHDPKHWVVALRQYYKNVKDLDDQIEIHFVDEVIPGYFWIFPAGNGLVNTGVGMPYKFIKKHKINLKELLANAIESPAFKERFKDAEALEGPQGWNLPMGSTHRKNYGSGFLLLGDAAGLIDPFSGEGIGNALYSGKIAAETAAEAVKENRFDEQFLSRYDKNLWKDIGPELDNSTKLQRLGQYRSLLNLVIKKASKSEEIREVISAMMANQVPRSTLTNPMFYLRLLFK